MSALAMNADFIAAGTCSGNIRVWRRNGETWERPAGSQDLQVEPSNQPCMTVCLGEAPDGATLLVGHSAAKSRLSVWRLVRAWAGRHRILLQGIDRCVDQVYAETWAHALMQGSARPCIA